MSVFVDARGLGCPQPVLRAKEAMEKSAEAVLLVDNAVAAENIRRLAEHRAYRFLVEDRGEGTLEITLTRKEDSKPADSEAMPEERPCVPVSGKEAGPLVVVLSDNRMGRGDDVLGDVLLRSFIHTLLQLNPLPSAVICYNAGVKLAVKDSAVLDDLKQLVQAGVDLVVCGTCVNYFSLGDQIAAGRISNMYEIAERMAGAGRMMRP